VNASDGTSALTDELGIYSMTFGSGTYTFTAQSEGYLAQSYSDVEIISGTYNIDFALQPITVTLTGQVSDAISLTYRGALMSIHSEPSELTDENGYYSFTNPELYGHCSADGYIPTQVRRYHLRHNDPGLRLKFAATESSSLTYRLQVYQSASRRR
jgi:hypothetical protein